MAWKVTETMILVSDLDASIHHYVDVLGFNLIEKQEWGFAMLTPDGAAHVGLLDVKSSDSDWKPGDPMPPPRVALQTDDIEAEALRLREAGADIDNVVGEPGTLRAIGFRDRDGNRFFLWDDGSGSLAGA